MTFDLRIVSNRIMWRKHNLCWSKRDCVRVLNDSWSMNHYVDIFDVNIHCHTTVFLLVNVILINRFLFNEFYEYFLEYYDLVWLSKSIIFKIIWVFFEFSFLDINITFKICWLIKRFQVWVSLVRNSNVTRSLLIYQF